MFILLIVFSFDHPFCPCGALAAWSSSAWMNCPIVVQGNLLLGRMSIKSCPASIIKMEIIMFIKSTKLKFKVEFCQVGLQGIVPLVEYPVWMLVVFT